MLTKNSPLKVTDPCERAVAKTDFLLEVARISVGVDQIEPLLSDLLEYMLVHPECEPVMTKKFNSMLDELPRGAETLIEFCMHELRWPGVHEHAKQCATAALDDPRKGLRYARILPAFDDGWPNRDLYLRYNPSRDDQ
jgi:hypothetical protein